MSSVDCLQFSRNWCKALPFLFVLCNKINFELELFFRCYPLAEKLNSLVFNKRHCISRFSIILRVIEDCRYNCYGFRFLSSVAGVVIVVRYNRFYCTARVVTRLTFIAAVLKGQADVTVAYICASYSAAIRPTLIITAASAHLDSFSVRLISKIRLRLARDKWAA